MAFHEAGHAVIAALHNLPFRQVTIVPDRETHGLMVYGKRHPLTRVYAAVSEGEECMVRAYVDAALAGPVAEWLQCRNVRQSADDIRQALSAAGMLLVWHPSRASARGLSSAQCRGLIRQRPGAVRQTLTREWPKVEAVAALLMQRLTLSASQVRSVVRKHPPPPMTDQPTTDYAASRVEAMRNATTSGELSGGRCHRSAKRAAKLAAYHEAGHALAAFRRLVVFECVTRSETAGGIDLTPAIHALTAPDVAPSARRRRARRLVEVCLAGIEAERLLTEAPPPRSCANCVLDPGALRLAGLHHAPELRDTCQERVGRLIHRHAEAVCSIAHALEARGSLTRAEVGAVLYAIKHGPMRQSA